MKCANCKNEASYEYRVTQTKSLFYCGKDLPKFLEERKKAGLLKITEKFNQDLATALETLSTPAVEVPIEVNKETPVEVLEEEPKIKKKPSKSED